MLDGRPRSLKPFKHGKSVVFFGARKRLTGEEITAGMIGDGQWIAVLMIPQQELALVIGAPQFICWPKDKAVPGARRRKRARRSTRPWRSSTAWIVLLAGILIPENLRIRRSRILRAPQLVCSRLTFRIKFST